MKDVQCPRVFYIAPMQFQVAVLEIEPRFLLEIQTSGKPVIRHCLCENKVQISLL